MSQIRKLSQTEGTVGTAIQSENTTSQIVQIVSEKGISVSGGTVFQTERIAFHGAHTYEHPVVQAQVHLFPGCAFTSTLSFF